MQYRKILVQVTPNKETDPAIEMGKRLARRHNAEITVFDVLTDLAWPLQYIMGGWEQTLEQLSGSKENRLRAISDELRADGFIADSMLANGRLAVSIIRKVVSGNYDLVVKAAEPALANRSGPLGSTDLRLVRKCPCPVLVLQNDHVDGFQHVAGAVDVMDDHEIQQRLDEQVVQSTGAMCDGRATLLYALPQLQEVISVGEVDKDLFTESQLEKWQSELRAESLAKLDALRSRLGELPAECHVLSGEPEDSVPEFVNGHAVDLLVMGTIARSGVDGFLIGNTADRMLGKLDCSILALKPAGFVSPLMSSSYAGEGIPAKSVN